MYERQIYPLDQGLRLLVTLTVDMLMSYRILLYLGVQRMANRFSSPMRSWLSSWL